MIETNHIYAYRHCHTDGHKYDGWVGKVTWEKQMNNVFASRVIVFTVTSADEQWLRNFPSSPWQREGLCFPFGLAWHGSCPLDFPCHMALSFPLRRRHLFHSLFFWWRSVLTLLTVSVISLAENTWQAPVYMTSYIHAAECAITGLSGCFLTGLTSAFSVHMCFFLRILLSSRQNWSKTAAFLICVGILFTIKWYVLKTPEWSHL